MFCNFPRFLKFLIFSDKLQNWYFLRSQYRNCVPMNTNWISSPFRFVLKDSIMHFPQTLKREKSRQIETTRSKYSISQSMRYHWDFPPFKPTWRQNMLGGQKIVLTLSGFLLVKMCNGVPPLSGWHMASLLSPNSAIGLGEKSVKASAISHLLSGNVG